MTLFSEIMQVLSILSKLSSRARMSILIAYLESSQKIEYDKYDIIDIRRDSIFRHLTHGGGLLVILDIFGNFLFF